MLWTILMLAAPELSGYRSSTPSTLHTRTSAGLRLFAPLVSNAWARGFERVVERDSCLLIAV